MEAIPEGRANERSATTAGAWLRNARQQRGLHIAALAVMLKVPQAKLEALEADRFDELPDATFARALATAMCRALKVDPAPVLALLPRTSTSEFDVRPGLNQPFRERGAGAIDGGVLALLARPVVWGPLLLLIAAAAVHWIPAGWLPERDTAASAPAASAASAAASAAPVEFVAAPPAASAAASVPEAASSAAASAPQPVASTPLQVRDVAPPPNVVAQPASAPAVPAGQALRISASADSWVEVADAKGQVLFSRVLHAGEQQEFGGAAPYKLRVGNVGGTRVEWRGAAVDLGARANNNVARLELN
ncbi:helix-turn-helix domain-containing protein [Roseateles saccharophilus]|uniref:Cytoskeleton protein RodZ n=1 Tax=Roseateles saccharophilus TaxID=304 RepID=A0A4V6P2I7_ROSSA|nr:helix-turn-helix domain-containing protein [Roseateles saccharophilus]MDG0833805.1 helix-turn-helix domain-containing protein [Roseateles saccharophilus]TCU91569.1 cytoskeleton protein RodZ [Roseateles saccharophilus]